jgi:integrase
MPYKNFNSNKDKFPWMGQVVLDGKQKRKQFASKREAVKWEVAEKGRVAEIVTASLMAWATAYFDFAQSRYTSKTYDEKRLAFRGLFQAVSPDAVNLSAKDVLAFLQRQAKERSGNAANKQRKNLHAAWEWGRKFCGLPRHNPFADVPRFATDREERRVPSLEEFWRVYDVAESSQDKAMLLAYLHTGARREELFRLRWRDVDFPGRRLRLFWRKNQAGQWNEAWLPMSDDLASALKAHQKATGLLGHVFLNPCDDDHGKWVPYQYRQHWLKILCGKAGVKPFGFHGIRHLFASLLAEAGRPLVEIQHMLRHGSIATTQRYIHLLKKENREVLAALPDLSSRTESALKAHQTVQAL